MAEGIQPWFRTVAYCELEDTSRRIALSRMARGEIDQAPIWNDVFTLRRGHVASLDIESISAGFPCTDISTAGARAGIRAERSGLFWEVVRLAHEIEPATVLLENVWPAVGKFIPTIRAQFDALGLAVRDGFLGASDIGLPHRRQRWFMFAYNHKNALRLQRRRSERADWENKVFAPRAVEAGENPDANKARVADGWPGIGDESKVAELIRLLEGDDWDAIAGEFLRMDMGHPYRSYRIGALGDSVPPIQTRKAFGILSGLMTNKKIEGVEP